MADPAPPSGNATRGAAARVARNTLVRAGAEIAGKFASLALMATLARREGPAGLGVLVFALAWCEVATAPVDMGFDRYLLRRVARDRAELDHCFFNVLRLKLLRAVPAVAISWLAVVVIGYGHDTRLAVFVLTGAFLLDGLSFTIFSSFNGVERGDLVGMTLLTQRLISGGLGIAVLLTGHGVVAVALVYLVASTVAFALALALLARKVGLPARIFPIGPRRELRRQSLPFAAQELLSAGLARADAILLAALATQAVVGYYGAAYRLLEATLFIPTALQGAFAAMYTYLDERSEPTINAVFGRSIKLVLVALTPCAVTLAVLPGQLLTLLYGHGFAAAVPVLRVLAPIVVMLGVVLLAASLIASRLNPRVLVVYFAVALVFNVALNLLLIPPLGATGAAIAMLAAEVAFAVLALRIAMRSVGALDFAGTAGGPLVAGAAMAAVMLALHGVLALALAAGVLAYAGVLLAVDTRLAPEDVRFLRGVARQRLPARLVARLPKAIVGATP